MLQFFVSLSSYEAFFHSPLYYSDKIKCIVRLSLLDYLWLCSALKSLAIVHLDPLSSATTNNCKKHHNYGQRKCDELEVRAHHCGICQCESAYFFCL